MLFQNPYHFDITTYWDGTPCSDSTQWGTVTLQGSDAGLIVTATLPHQKSPHIPNAPVGTRVANLWEYDVVECFLVGSEKYLEIELGAGGNWLVLDFTAPRIRNNEYSDFTPITVFTKHIDAKSWQSSITIPWSIVPHGLHAANAFVIVGEHYLCASPLPGPKADFHQPKRFPEL